MIRVTFADQASRDAFADRFGVADKVNSTELDIAWNLLQFAKLDDKALDYDDLESSDELLEFIVKGDPVKFQHLKNTSIKKDLGNGFYLIETSEATLLGDFVDNIEHNGPAMSLMGVSTINEVNAEPTTIDPTSADAQWHRIRIVSKYRPLATEFSTHDLSYVSKPEIYIMDSGINFEHPEFDYPELETEHFYTLPAFNGLYDDDVGHGTLVAATAVGKNLGICNHAKLINVKVGKQDHNPTLLELGESIDAIVTRASADPLKTRIVNMSWTVLRSSWLDAKVQSLLDLGITVICAAGNLGRSVEDISPAGLDTVITVGSIDKYDIPSGFNDISPTDAGITTGTGLSLDIFAPGENVVIADYKGGYGITSGTSVSAPIVSGIAGVIGALNEGMIPYDQMKKMILDSATKDALLFTDDRFSENQNNLAYLFTADNGQLYKSKNLLSYLGVHTTDEPILADLRSAIDTSNWIHIFPDLPITWSIEFLDPEVEKVYAEFLDVNATTGMIQIDKPTTTLPEATKLKMVDFKAIATNGKISAESGILFFFDTNPLYKTTLEGDITLALTEVNSISFYAAWGSRLK